MHPDDPQHADAPTRGRSDGDSARRDFLRGALGAGLVAGAGLMAAPAVPAAAPSGVGTRAYRDQAALAHRIGRAQANLTGYARGSMPNGDERADRGYAGCFAKGLPHDAAGDVDPAAYRALLGALHGGDRAALAAVPMGGTARLANPLAAFAFQTEGADPSRLSLLPAPALASEQRAAEMVEVYWMSLLRDLPFARYGEDERVAAAVADLRRFALFAGVDATTLFRGVTAGERIGPYLSQFLWLPVPYGPTVLSQRYAAGAAAQEFMTTVEECVGIQRGRAPSATLMLGAPHYLRDGRDLSEYVHRDFSYQAFLAAATLLLGLGPRALAPGNPYKALANQAGFVTFGGPDVLSAVAQIAVHALKAAWWQKWAVHRVLRPEACALRVHQHVAGVRDYGLHPALLASPVLDRLASAQGSLLLPMAYPEGSPLHPSYPAGHATIAGACVTVLKAFFDESVVLPAPVQASDDGSELLPWTGEPLTIGHELDKLAANIAIGRNHAGVHYWSDGIEGMRLGERVAMAWLADLRSTYAEEFDGFAFTGFDGRAIRI